MESKQQALLHINYVAHIFFYMHMDMFKLYIMVVYNEYHIMYIHMCTHYIHMIMSV